MKDLGKPKYFLGIKTTRDKESRLIQINQTEYAEKILERFNMKNCVPRNPSMEKSRVQRRISRLLAEKSKQNSI